MRAPPSLAACFHMHLFCLGSSSSSCCDAPLAEVRGHRPSPSTLCAELGASVPGGRKSPRLPHCLLGRRCPGCNQASSRCSRAVSDSASNRSSALQEMGPLSRNSRLSALLLLCSGLTLFLKCRRFQRKHCSVSGRTLAMASAVARVTASALQ